MKQLLKNTVRVNPLTAALLTLSAVVLGFIIYATFAATQVTTTKSGNWSDPSLWSTNQVPKSGDQVIINAGHNVTYDVSDSKVSGLQVNPDASLTFAPGQTVTLETDRNVIIEGLLRMRPSSANINHTLRFVNIDESKFVGGGMDPIDTDIGLWVMGAGQLDIQGAEKKSWTRAASAIPQGTTTIQVEDATNWRAGDEIAISPTEPPSVGSRSYEYFHEATITSLNGNTITLSTPTPHPHPLVNNKWTAEVMNLTRNVRIEGTPGGRTHTMIRSTHPSRIKHAQFRHYGPEFPRPDMSTGTGRYGMHFHFNRDGSRGSIVEGTVIRDGASNAYVPHASDGINFKDAIAYNIGDSSGFWWDGRGPLPDDCHDCSFNDAEQEVPTHDTMVDGMIVAKVPGTTISGGAYRMGAGSNNTVQNSVAVGFQGRKNSSGFAWGTTGNNQNGAWHFFDNISHNNEANGIFVWQNTNIDHFINRFSAYHNGHAGVQHGAYRNTYQYRDMELHGNGVYGIEMHAATLNAHGERSIQTWENIQITAVPPDGAGISVDRHRLSFGHPIIVRNVNIEADTKVRIDSEFREGTQIDFIHSLAGPQDVDLVSADPDARIRIQSGSNAWQITPSGTTSISSFADSNGEYIKPPKTDHEPPTVAFGSSPANGSTLTGVVELRVSAADNVSVESIQYWFNGEYFTRGQGSRNRAFWDTERFPSGEHLLEVHAVDAAGNISKDQRTVIIWQPWSTDIQQLPGEPDPNPTPPPPEPTPPPPSPEPTPGDINGDGQVDIFDLSILLSKWGTNDPSADLNGDGVVNIFDLSILLSNWGS